MSDDMLEDRPRQAPRRGAEPVFNIPGAVLLFVGLCTAIHLVRVYLLDRDQDFSLIIAAAFIPVRYSGDYMFEIYAVTSPLTYSLLHGGWAHLAVNMIWLAAFGSPLANRLGALRFILFWCATSLAAVLLHYLLHMHSEIPLVGASGAISGMMGAAARFGFHIDRDSGRSRFAGPLLSIPRALGTRAVLAFLLIWMAINLFTGLYGMVPGEENSIAWEAHIGGFLAGFLGIRPFIAGRPA